MGPLGRVAVRSTAAVALAVGLVAAGAALVRILPWLVDPRVPGGAAGVFARGLLAAAAEATLMVALPVGCALAAASFADRGEARACFLSGASPESLARSTWPVALVASLLAATAGAMVARDAAAPARVMEELTEASRRGCDERSRPVAEVPGTPATWLCAPGERPLLAVPLGSQGVARASVVELSGDGLTLRLLASRFDHRGPPTMHLETEQTTIVGFAGAGAPSRLGMPLRAFAAGTSTGVGALAVMAALLRRSIATRSIALALGGVTAAVLLLGLRAMERTSSGWAGALALSAASLVPALAFLAGERALPRSGTSDRPR